ncbi:SusC/RagA family TonB-linked outer membrane protein [Gemmatimonadetes bacterium T265]|nr:SusC/RagA family TonB-linked outer membrane protein [Gemmatimonadetes bacterium T265]
MNKQFSRALAMAAVGIATPAVVRAQTAATVTGRVTTSDGGQPIIAASVFIATLNVGATTREDGTYTLVVPAARVNGQAVSLSVRRVGYRNTTAQITLRGGTIRQDFSLTGNALQLGAVVVTGAGTLSTTERLGTARTTVDSNLIVRSNEVNLSNALGGKAPGVFVQSSSGEPGASTQIRLRGITSLQGSDGQPLIVVDGSPIDNSTNFEGGAPANSGAVASNRLADINPNDIENVEILKGAAASAIYGSRGGQGAILITTRKGRAGATRYSLRSNTTFDGVTRTPDLQRQFTLGNLGSDGVTPVGVRCRSSDSVSLQNCSVGFGNAASWGPAIPAGTPTYDHATEMFTNGHQYDNTISVSGGGDRASFYGSGGALDQRGIITGPSNYLRRYTGRVNASLQASSRFNLGGNFSIIQSNTGFVQSRNSVSSLLLGAWRSPADFDNEQYIENGVQRSYRFPNPTPASALLTRGYDNPFFTANDAKSTSDVGRAIGNVNANYIFTPWLRANYVLGADYSNNETLDGLPWTASTTAGIGGVSPVQAPGQVTRGYAKNFQLDQNVTLTADYTLSSVWKGNATLGQNLNQRVFRTEQAFCQVLLQPQPYNCGNTATQLPPNDFRSVINVDGYFLQGTADLFSQLFLTATIRNDGASTFGSNNRRAWYPKGSVAWNVIRPDASSSTPALGTLKLRAAYGQTGTQPQPYLVYPGYNTLTFGDGYIGGVSTLQNGAGGLNTGGRLANPNLSTERVGELEVGADFSAFRDILTGQLTYFDQTTSNAVFDVPVAATTGYTVQAFNAGRFWNRGAEVALTVTPIKTQLVNWDVTLGYTHLRSRVTDLRGAKYVDMGGTGGLGGITGAAIQGQQVGVYYGTDFVRCGRGIVLADGTNVDNTCSPAANKAKGLWISSNGYPILDQIGQYVIGDPNPKWTGSVRSGLRVGKFSFSTLVETWRGIENYNGTRGALNYFGKSMETAVNRTKGATFVFGQNYLPGVVGGPGAGTKVPLDQTWYQGAGGIFNGPASLFIENGSFTRWRELTVAYLFDGAILRQATGFSSIELRVAGRNLGLSTKYTGVDPETTILGAATPIRGIDYFNNPQSRSFVIGVTVNR